MAVFGKAQYIKRVEDDRLLTGTGGFTDNLARPNQAHVVLVRSPHAHARIVKIDAVAAVIAESRAQAQDAAELVEVEYDPLPSVSEIEDALKPGAPQVWKGAPGNMVGFNRFGDVAKVDAAFRQAAHVVSLDIVHQRLIVNAMEPRAVMAEWDGDRLIVHIGSQNPQGTRDTLCDVILKMPKDKVRVVVRDIGGGFGMKVGIQPDEAVAVWAAKVLKRPVKWHAERSEEFA